MLSESLKEKLFLFSLILMLCFSMILLNKININLTRSNDSLIFLSFRQSNLQKLTALFTKDKPINLELKESNKNLTVKVKELGKLQSLFTQKTSTYFSYLSGKNDFTLYNKLSILNQKIGNIYEKAYEECSSNEKNTTELNLLSSGSITISSSTAKNNIQLNILLETPEKFSADKHQLLIMNNGNYQNFWIEQLSEGKIKLWLHLNSLQKNIPVIYQFFFTDNNQSLLNSPFNSGEKVFPFFADKNNFHKWQYQGDFNPDININIIPENEGFIVNTSNFRKDSSVYLETPPLKDDLVIEYKFKNFKIPVSSYQLQLAAWDNNNKLLSCLDSPSYGRVNQVVFRRQTNSYREIHFANIEFEKSYKAMQVIYFSKQRTDYRFLSEDRSYFLFDQYFQTGGRVTFSENPKSDYISKITTGSACPDDLGKTLFYYILIRKYIETPPLITIKYDKHPGDNPDI